MVTKKRVVTSLVIVVVVASVSLFVRGQFPAAPDSDVHNISIGPPPALYSQPGGRIVSGVASPVSTVIVSNVTSNTGTSRVASVLTTPVASAVLFAANSTAQSVLNLRNQVNLSALKSLTERELEKLAWEDFESNPEKYTITEKEKAQLISLYRKSHPEQFISPDWIQKDPKKFEKYLPYFSRDQIYPKKTVHEKEKTYLKEAPSGKVQKK
jgi:hypothetical protein